jgi:hypothetical protein
MLKSCSGVAVLVKKFTGGQTNMLCHEEYVTHHKGRKTSKNKLSLSLSPSGVYDIPYFPIAKESFATRLES